MKSPDVNIDVCQVLLSEYLEGYLGYPRTAAGVRRFAVALQENCVSVGHVRGVLKSFDESFPTVRQMHDVAFGLRPQFEPQEDTRDELEREYGKPAPFNLYPTDEMAMHWQALRDMLYYTEGPAKDMKNVEYWEDGMRRALHPEMGNHGDSIAFVRNQAREMGWPAIMALTASPIPFPYRKPQHGKLDRGTKDFPRITQADVLRAEQARRKSTMKVDRELDGWDDPDR